MSGHKTKYNYYCNTEAAGLLKKNHILTQYQQNVKMMLDILLILIVCIFRDPANW